MKPEQEVTVQGPAGPLAGTLLHGPVRRAMALIVPGSGPTDRNGNGPPGSGLRCNAYAKLAKALASYGISTLRIDKRGIGRSVGDGNAVTMADYAADLAAWLQFLTLLRLPIWLIGHSEGGIVALHAAPLAAVRGLVLLACPGQPLDRVLMAQLAAVPANAPLLGAARLALDQLAQGRTIDVSALPSLLQALFAPQVQGFWASLLAHAPADLASRITKPMLIVQGGQDLQVSVTDAECLAAAAPLAEICVLPLMNHVLTDVAPGDTTANWATYDSPDAALPAALSSRIAAAIS